jgi:digeranylgeranylglycerophospholipid reductase
MGVRLYGSKPDQFIAYDAPGSEPLMYGTSRRRFDEVLLRLARDAGAEVHTRATVKRVKVAKEQVEVVLEDGRTFRSQIVVGAGGMQDPVAKVLREREGLPRSWPSGDIGFAVAHEYEVGERFISESFGEGYTCHFHMKPQGIYGYAWAFPRRSSINVGFGAFLKEIKKMDIRAGFKAYLSLLKRSGLFPKNIDDIVFKGARLPLRGPIERTSSDRMLLVGDGAGFVSPLSGDGISFAMTSGRLAADVAGRCLEDGDCSRKALLNYDRAWKRIWKEDFQVLCHIADIVEGNLDSVVEVCQKDKKLVKMLVGVYNGRACPSKVVNSMKRRYLRGMLLRKLSGKGDGRVKH